MAFRAECHREWGISANHNCCILPIVIVRRLAVVGADVTIYAFHECPEGGKEQMHRPSRRAELHGASQGDTRVSDYPTRVRALSVSAACAALLSTSRSVYLFRDVD